MRMSRSIAVVEDEASIRENYLDAFRRHGFAARGYPDRASAERAFAVELPDLVIIDIGLGDEHEGGFELCRGLRARSQQLPIIFLTAKNLKDDVIEGFKMGADDYITKPFSMEELIFRIEAILRRTAQESQNSSPQVFSLGKYTFDTRKQILTDAEKTVKLTTKESDLLKLLCQNANKVLERNYALKSIWIDDNYFNARSMDVYITKLRKHLKDESSVEIINVHGKGYKLII